MLSSGNENMGVSRADNPPKSDDICQLAIPNQINAHTKFGENALMFTQVIVRKRNTDGRTDVQRTDGQTQGRPT